MTTVGSSVDVYKDIDKIKQACNELEGKLKGIGGRLFAVASTKELEDLQQEIAKITKSFNNLLSTASGDVSNLLQSYYKLNNTIKSLDPDKKFFTTRICYKILSRMGWKSLKLNCVGDEESREKLTAIVANALGINKEAVSVTADQVIVKARNEEKRIAASQFARKDFEFSQVVKDTVGKIKQASQQIQSTLLSQINKKEVLQISQFAFTPTPEFSQENLLNYYPLQPGEWFIANISNQPTLLYRKSASDIQNARYPIKANLTTLPQELTGLKNQISKIEESKIAEAKKNFGADKEYQAASDALSQVKSALSNSAMAKTTNQSNLLALRSFKSEENFGLQECVENYPLNPGEWFIAVVNNQPTLIYREQDGVINKQQPLKTGSKLPEDLKSLKDSITAVQAGQFEIAKQRAALRTALASIKEATIDSNQKENLKKFGLLKNCWECLPVSKESVLWSATKYVGSAGVWVASGLFSAVTGFFSRAPKQEEAKNEEVKVVPQAKLEVPLFLKIYDAEGKERNVVLREQPDGVHFWDNQTEESFGKNVNPGMKFENRDKLKEHLQSIGITTNNSAQVLATGNKKVATGNAIMSDPAFVESGKEENRLKAILLARGLVGGFYCFCRPSGITDGAKFQAKLFTIDEYGVLQENTLNVEVMENGKLSVDKQEYDFKDFLERVKEDGSQTLKSAAEVKNNNDFSLAEDVSSIKQKLTRLKNFFPNNTIPESTAFWAVNEQPGMLWGSYKPTLISIKKGDVSESEFSIGDNNKISLGNTTTNTISEAAKSVTQSNRPYKFKKTMGIIDKVVQGLEKLQSKVTYKNQQYQISVKKPLQQVETSLTPENEGVLVITSGGKAIELKYKLEFDKDMVLWLKVKDGQTDIGKLDVGDYEEDYASTFSDKTLQNLLSKIESQLPQAQAATKAPAPSVAVSKPALRTVDDQSKIVEQVANNITEWGRLSNKKQTTGSGLQASLLTSNPKELISKIYTTKGVDLHSLAESIADWKREDKLLLAAICCFPSYQERGYKPLEQFASYILNQKDFLQKDGVADMMRTKNAQIAKSIFEKIDRDYDIKKTLQDRGVFQKEKK